MDFKKKLIPLTMTFLLGIGTLGIANAAVPTDFQQQMANWVANDPNPMPMNMDSSGNVVVTDSTAVDSNTSNTNSTLGSIESISDTTLTVAGNAYNLADQVTVYLDNQPAELDDLQTGLSIHIDLNANGDVFMIEAYTNTAADTTDTTSTNTTDTNVSNSNDANTKNTDTNADVTNTNRNNQPNKNTSNTQPANDQSNTYNQMVQNCINNQQMMQNITPEQMLEMDKAWMESMSQQQNNNSQQWNNGWSQKNHNRLGW